MARSASLKWALATGVSVLITGQLHAQTEAGASPEQGGGLEEIIVTASKRAERLQDAPLAITAMSQEKLENLGVASFTDYVALVPNLGQAGGVAPGAGNVILRGLYSGPESRSTTAAFYLGESLFTPSGSFGLGSLQTPDPDLIDVERIEVLKGPQGTLFGAQSLGGLVRIIPRQPDVDRPGVRGKVRTIAKHAAGGDLGYGIRGSIEGALVPGKLAVSLSGFGRKDPGFLSNARTGHDDLGATDASGGTLTAVFQPIDRLSVSMRAVIQEADTTGQLAQWNRTATLTPMAGDRTMVGYIDESAQTDYEIYELVGKYEWDLGTLTAVATQGHTELERINDYTSAYGFVIGAQANNYGVRGISHPQSDMENYEVRFASRRMGAIEFMAGGFMTEQDHDYVVGLYGETLAGVPLTGAAGEIVTQHSLVTFKEKAVFGNVTVYLGSEFDVTAGVRSSNNDQDGGTAATGILGRPAGSPPSPHHSDDSSTVYQFTARWRPSDDLSLYARAASGYRPGGPNGSTAPVLAYEPDTVWNYELGAKGALLDRRLRFDGSVYYIDWQDVQLNGRAQGFIFGMNGGAAEIKGAELQSEFAMTPNFDLGASLGYNDAELTRVDPAVTLAIGALRGDRLPGSAQWSGSVYADYRTDLTASVSAGMGATFRYQGDRVSSYSNDLLNTKLTIPGYETLDLRGVLTWRSYALRLAVDNVFDKNGINGYNTLRVLPGQAVQSYAYLIRPRTVSLSLDVSF